MTQDRVHSPTRSSRIGMSHHITIPTHHSVPHTTSNKTNYTPSSSHIPTQSYADINTQKSKTTSPFHAIKVTTGIHPLSQSSVGTTKSTTTETVEISTITISIARRSTLSTNDTTTSHHSHKGQRTLWRHPHQK
jgi:hypothetical protein